MKFKKKELSQSAQLRFQLNLLWEKGSKEKSFEEYYKDCMQKLISQIKTRIHG